MMKKYFVLGMILMLVLGACSPARNEGVAETAVSGHLNADYAEALPVQSQLILGTLSLEGTEQAVNEAEAAELLPLWQAVQSLGQSDVTAGAEVTAVLNQIQDIMRDEQITAIAAMQITADDMQTIIQDQGLPFGPGRGNAAEDGQQAERGGLDGPGGGGPPGGGAPGGGQLGGAGGLGNLTEDERATRVAERFGGGDVASQFLINPLITLLQVKTGAAAATVQLGGRGFDEPLLEVVSEATGLAIEEIRAQTADGKTLAEVVVENGGDLEAVRAQLIQQFSRTLNAQENSVAEQVDAFLNSTGGRQP